MTENTALQFPVIEKMTETMRRSEYKNYFKRLQDKLDLISYEDNELIELIDAFVGAIHWLKDNHDKEGSIAVSFKRKDSRRAKLKVSGKYSQSVNETDTEQLKREFLSKSVLLYDKNK